MEMIFVIGLRCSQRSSQGRARGRTENRVLAACAGQHSSVFYHVLHTDVETENIKELANQITQTFENNNLYR